MHACISSGTDKAKIMISLAFHTAVAVLLCHFPLATAWRSFKVQFDNVTVTTNPEWTELDVQITESNGHSTLDFYLNVLKTINHPKLHGYLRLDSIPDSDIDTSADDTEESVEIFNQTMNLCQVMATKKMDPLLKVAFSAISKNGMWFRSCPIQSGRYYLQHFRIDEENLPSYLPETDFLIEVHLFSEPKSGRLINFWTVILNGRIDKSKALDDFKIFTMG